MKKITNITLFFILFVSVSTLISCKDDDTTDPAELTLYQKLGGTTLVQDPSNPSQQIEQGRLSYRLVVDSTINLIVADIVADAPGNLAEYFAPILAEVGAGNTTNLALLSKNLTDFFAANTGGGATNTYSGLDMVTAHDPALNPRMGIASDNADYDKFVGYVVAAAAQNGVTDQALVAEVGAVLESLRAPIVQR